MAATTTTRLNDLPAPSAVCMDRATLPEVPRKEELLRSWREDAAPTTTKVAPAPPKTTPSTPNQQALPVAQVLSFFQQAVGPLFVPQPEETEGQFIGSDTASTAASTIPDPLSPPQNHKRGLFKRFKKKDHLLSVPPIDIESVEDGEFVVLDYELVATACTPAEEEEEYQRCWEEAMVNSRTCHGAAQSGVRKGVKHIRKWIKRRNQKEEEQHNISERSAQSYLSTDSHISTASAPPNRKSKRKLRRKNRRKQRPTTPPLATVVPQAQAVQCVPFSHEITSSLSFGAAVHHVSMVEELAREDDVVRIQNVTREEFDSQDDLICQINQALEEDYSCPVEYPPPPVYPIFPKEEVIEETHQLKKQCREIIEEVKMHLRKCSESSLTLPVEEVRDVVEEMRSQDAVKPELAETTNELIASVDAEPSQLPKNEEQLEQVTPTESITIQTQTLEDDEEEELPIIEELERIYNHQLKLILVGSSSKSTLASSLSSSSSSLISTWTPSPEIQFSIWNVPSNTPQHSLRDLSSACYSNHALYIVTWDGAMHDPSTFMPCNNDNGYQFEVQCSKVTQSLQRDLDACVLPDLYPLIHSDKQAVIVPVLTFDRTSEEGDVARRAKVFHDRMQSLNRDGLYIKNVSLLSREKGMYQKEGMEQLRQSLMQLSSSASFPQLGKHVPRLTLTIQDIVQDLRARNCKVASLDLLMQSLAEEEYDDGCAVKRQQVISSLLFLCSIGQVLYYKDSKEASLQDFVILDVEWFMGAASCVLSRDWKRELVKWRRMSSFMSSSSSLDESLPLRQSRLLSEDLCVSSSSLEEKKMEEGDGYQSIHTRPLCNILSNCAAITIEDSDIMWHSMNFMREAVENAYPTSSSDYEEQSKALFSYLRCLLVHHGVFVPVPIAILENDGAKSSTSFLLPSLFHEIPSNVWSYKTRDAWKTTLSHSWLFHDVVLPPSHLMPRIMATVLKDVANYVSSEDAMLEVAYFNCWKSAFFLELDLITLQATTGQRTRSRVKLFAHLDTADSNRCVASDTMTDSMYRLAVSAKGNIGFGGRKVWEGGYDLVLRSVEGVVNDYMSQHGQDCGEVEREIVCPNCLALHHHNVAATVNRHDVLAKRNDGVRTIRCRRGCPLDSAMLCGIAGRGADETLLPLSSLVSHENSVRPSKLAKDLMGGVVLIGLWDGDEKKIISAGTGFIADRKQGLVITASHVLMKMEQGHKKFGRDYFGLKKGKAVIGVIPRSSDGSRSSKAVFRYFAEIISKDVEHMDACVLRITTRMEEDVGGQGEGCGDQPEILLLNDSKAIKAQKLKRLQMTQEFAMEEGVRILGYNQGGEGLFEKGEYIHNTLDVVRGYVSCLFENDINVNMVEKDGLVLDGQITPISLLREPAPVGIFSPRKEIVVRCPTIPGHSGGPCVNHDGEVIGIVSRADPVESERCYLAPSSELKVLMEKAKDVCNRNPNVEL
mmetsp:Transcript_15805/g.21175  ORF Transcript_15805/g.21175 Transcript_15805/m.21175 type:complete len:1452 (+) Transcript_15805:128-4483(+)